MTVPTMMPGQEPYTVWENDGIQFPRLLAEIMAAGVGEAVWDELLASMDLESDQLSELFDRAQVAFERSKAILCPPFTHVVEEKKMAMKVRPLDDWRHAGYPPNTALDKTKIYSAIAATNQPNWKEEGKIFIECPNGAPALLVSKEEYEIVEKDDANE